MIPIITQLTREEAARCLKNRLWEGWSPFMKALFQLHQERLCMPFDVYQASLCHVLNRRVETHELQNRAALLAELDRYLTDA